MTSPCLLMPLEALLRASESDPPFTPHSYEALQGDFPYILPANECKLKNRILWLLR